MVEVVPRPSGPSGPSKPAHPRRLSSYESLIKHKDGQRGFATSIAVFLVLGVALPAIVINFSGLATHPAAIEMALVVTVYAAFAIAQICYDGAAQIMRLAYYIFVYAFMGLPVLAQLTSNHFPLISPTTGGYTAHETAQAYLVVFVGVAAFEVTAQLVTIMGKRREDPDSSASDPGGGESVSIWRMSEGRLLALGVIGLIVAAIIVSRSGLQPFFDSRQAATNAIANIDLNAKAYESRNKAISVLLGHMSKVPLLISLFGILYLKRTKQWHVKSQLQRTFSQVVIALLIVANVIVNDPIANSRFWMCTVAISFVSIYLPLNRSTAIRWAAIGSVFVLLFGFTTLQAFRRTGGAEDRSTGFRSDLLTAGTYAEYQVQLAAERYEAIHGHTYGKQALGSIFGFVPRQIWSSKAVDTGNVVLPYNNPAATLWTEGDVDGGLLGVIGYMVLVGVGVAVADRKFKRAPPGSLWHAFVPVGAGFVIFLLRGSLQPALAPGYVLIFAIWFVRRRTKEVAPAAAKAVEAAPSPRPLSI